MNFKEISFKMFKQNIRRYILYMLSNSFAVMIFFLYITIYTNKDFNDPLKLDPMISSNIFGSILILSVFLACFIVYSHNYFIKLREKDFGIFMTIGMTDMDIRKIIIDENMIIVVLSLVLGLFFGTLVSSVFYAVVLKIIEVNISLSINLKSYIYTAAFFGVISMVSILKSCVVIGRCNIANLLKGAKKKDNNFLGKRSFGILGVICVVLSIAIQVFINSKVLIYMSIAVYVIGIYLIISNLQCFIEGFLKIRKNQCFKNLFFISNIRYKIGSSKNILFSITMLITVVIFFASMIFTGSKEMKNYALRYNPYDAAYAELYGKNQLSTKDLNNIVKSENTKISSLKSLEIVQDRMPIISDKNLNSTVGTNFKVNKVKFIYLYQIDKNDGYDHSSDNMNLKSCYINNNVYYSQGKMEKVIFNNVNLINNTYLIVNNDDYVRIKEAALQDSIGSIKLINFNTDWHKTQGIINKLTNKLNECNKNKSLSFKSKAEDMDRFKPSSKIDTYKLTQDSDSFLKFLFSFIFVLFFIASNLMFYFKLSMEYEYEKVKYNKVYKIGITERETSRNILKELGVMFLSPCVLAIGVYFLLLLRMDMNAFKYALMSGTGYTLLEVIICLIYGKKYVKKFI